MGAPPSSKSKFDLSAEDISDLDRLLRLLQARQNGDPADLIGKARIVIRERERRAELLGKSMFGEPAWDMLLRLYVAEDMSLTVGNMVKLVGEPKTTVLRWAAYLEEKRLIARRNDAGDRRVVWLDLSDRGNELLQAYFSSFSTTDT